MSDKRLCERRDSAYLDASGLVEPVLLHVHDLAGLAVDAPRVLAVRVFGLGDGAIS